MVTKSRHDEIYCDWQIASARAVVCLRRFRSTYDLAWIEMAEKHLSRFSGVLADMDRRWSTISDPVLYLRADRIRDAGDD